jgi:TetR/AcrR family transcriptional regulator
MALPRRMAVDGTERRELLVQAAAELLRDEGYAALSARRVTEKAGLKSQLLYYYFETMDDLTLAVLRRADEQRRQRFQRALAAPEPLFAIWRVNNDPDVAILSTELISLAAHRETVRAEIIRIASEFRKEQVEAVRRLLQERGVDLEACPPEALVMIATSVARTISGEEALGLTDCHAAAVDLVERTIAAFLRTGPGPAEP